MMTESEYTSMQAYGQAIARMASPVPWQWFVTATLPWKARAETVEKKFAELHDGLERAARAKIAFLVAKEAFSKGGDYVGNHLHFVLASVGAVSPTLIKEHWRQLVGRQKGADENDDSILVEPYAISEKGLEYIVKQAGTADGWWDCKWLEDYNKELGPTIVVNHKSIRAAKRTREQLERQVA
jgi:hypothetical protein